MSAKRNVDFWSEEMRAVLQRVSRASVTVDEQMVGQIGQGLVILLGIGQQDSEAQVKTLVDKIVYLRIFEDENSKMNRSLLDIHGEVLVISQFTLYANMQRGRRPSFIEAAPPALANPLYEVFKATLANHGLRIASGIFGAMMHVELCNEGPVTIWLDSADL